MSSRDIKQLFGKAIRFQRLDQGISQEELADRAGLHRTYISDVERGVRNLSLGSIERLATALSISVSSLFAQAANGHGIDGSVEILLVDDDANDINMALRAFRDACITNVVRVARDGAEALEMLLGASDPTRAVETPLPGLVLLDLKLPKIDGLEVLRRIKADRRTQAIPVVILTASTQERDIAECRRLGAELYITKPVGFQNFSEITPHLKMEWVLRKPAVAPTGRPPGNESVIA